MISKETLRRFARGHIFADELPSAESMDNQSPDRLDTYPLAIHDIREALTLFSQGDTDINRILFQWFDALIDDLWYELELPSLLGITNEDYEEDFDLWDQVNVLYPSRDSELMINLMLDFDSIKDEWSCETVDSQDIRHRFDDMIHQIDNYFIYQEHPESEYPLTRLQMRRYIKMVEEPDILARSSQETRETFRQFLETLCEQDDPHALEVKGYACYGKGHPVYPCDWYTSRDCFLRLMELTDGNQQACYANTLGYIYYYGRCNQRVPQYEEAFRYFALAAFNGFYEATYKLADMFAAGKGTVKSPSTAFRLYRDIYTDSRQRFLRGDYNTNFADVALRMGGCYEKGTGVPVNHTLAYSYYLEAQKAICLRRELHPNHYGDDVVASRVDEAIQRIESKVPTPIHQKEAPILLLPYAASFIKEHPLHVRCVVVQNHNVTITIQYEQEDSSYRQSILAIPALSLCTLTDRLVFHVKGSDISLSDSIEFPLASVRPNQDGGLDFVNRSDQAVFSVVSAEALFMTTDYEEYDF